MMSTRQQSLIKLTFYTLDIFDFMVSINSKLKFCECNKHVCLKININHSLCLSDQLFILANFGILFDKEIYLVH